MSDEVEPAHFAVYHVMLRTRPKLGSLLYLKGKDLLGCAQALRRPLLSALQYARFSVRGKVWDESERGRRGLALVISHCNFTFHPSWIIATYQNMVRTEFNYSYYRAWNCRISFDLTNLSLVWLKRGEWTAYLGSVNCSAVKSNMNN